MPTNKIHLFPVQDFTTVSRKTKKKHYRLVASRKRRIFAEDIRPTVRPAADIQYSNSLH